MLKQALEYLVGLKENKTYVIDGNTYSDHGLHLIEKPVDRPKSLDVTGLDSIVQLVKREIERVDKTMLPVYIRVDNEKQVTVFTSYDQYMTRNYLYKAASDAPGFREGFREYDKAIIELRSRFIPNDGVNYLLDLLSRINKDNGVTTEDNGVSQTVEARSGVSIKKMEAVKPRVVLCPFRTFSEVPQPESEFLVRLDDKGNVGLFEADGGMWKLDAKQKIAEYFHEELSGLIDIGAVVVMR